MKQTEIAERQVWVHQTTERPEWVQVENSCYIVSLRPINALKFNIFVYMRSFSEEFV